VSSPSSPKRAVTTRDIAQAAGVAQSTVSRALRNAPSISAAERERIKKIAQKLGYRPNPFVAAFTAQVMHYRRSPQGAVIAFIECNDTETVYSRDYQEGARNRAHELGFSTEVFRLADVNHSFPRLNKVLQARGISAALILSVPAGVDFSTFDFEPLACAAVDPTLHYPEVSRAEPDYFQNMQLALETLEARGYRRPTFGTYAEESALISNAWLGAFTAWQAFRPREDRMEPCLNVWGREKFAQWCRRHKPDAIICNSLEYFAWAAESGYEPPDVAYVFLGAGPHRPVLSRISQGHPLIGKELAQRVLSGVNQNRLQVGAFAVDNIVAQIHRNEYGLHRHPNTLMVHGTWVEGETIRPA
jgi:LacI family transcriptional regulator